MTSKYKIKPFIGMRFTAPGYDGIFTVISHHSNNLWNVSRDTARTGMIGEKGRWGFNDPPFDLTILSNAIEDGAIVYG